MPDKGWQRRFDDPIPLPRGHQLVTLRDADPRKVNMNNDRLLRELLPYRMQAVAILNLALKLQATFGAAPMNIYAKDMVEGNLNAFTNPAIESGLMHCRALLEFLGLCKTADGRLGNIKKRRSSSDVGIENFSNSRGHLKKVVPDEALNCYPGPRDEAENALLAVFQITNKGLAHVTEDLIDNPEHGSLIEIASRGVPSLMVAISTRRSACLNPITNLLNDLATDLSLSCLAQDEPKPLAPSEVANDSAALARLG